MSCLEAVFYVFIAYVVFQWTRPLNPNHVNEMINRNFSSGDPEPLRNDPEVGDEMSFLYLHDQFVNDMGDHHGGTE